MNRERLTAKGAWAAIGLGVLAYELGCPAGQTLSEGIDQALETHPLLIKLAVGVTALHLINALPERVDPFSHALKLIKGS